ncbi:hypothetical protein [Clostridium tetanomorphum]|nr:hypothetical protein [Clostridium tetanomorphum]
MSYGRKIMVVSENMDNLEQTVGDIARFNNKKHAYIKSKDEATFTFITEKTEIVNDKGEKSSIEDINVGSKLRLYFSEKDEMINLIGYLPSIYMPEKVVILGKQNESLLATEGNISNLLNNKDRVSILVKGKKVTEQGYSEIRLNLDKNIKIISAKNRKELLCKDLKEGQHILVYYDRKVTRSLPPIGNCREIVVLE